MADVRDAIVLKPSFDLLLKPLLFKNDFSIFGSDKSTDDSLVAFQPESGLLFMRYSSSGIFSFFFFAVLWRQQHRTREQHGEVLSGGKETKSNMRQSRQNWQGVMGLH